MTELNSYRWAKFKNGVGAVAVVTLSVDQSTSHQNEIYEHYSGKGFVGQGYIEEVPETGYDSWKIAARKGLEFAFSKTDNFWVVNIFKIEGSAFTYTNPAVVGYTVIRAFFEKINFHLNQNQMDILEEFVMSSWKQPYKELIPDFLSMKFIDYNG
ncbi:hypothetical protein HNP38_000802 [Chryseobacterium defluvii]|uniref:Uncharacterized protein n=1 Tax=Chryseobacterium defluvii TaxID=160396 RepID=A0A840KDB3_9FLAO|nr:hypothetical protein [Chryseobacterium defluvii]MBB4805530.1 hypothetical protein [Chryseobacterium defluvii]